MEGYTNISGDHEDFDDLDIEGRITIDDWTADIDTIPQVSTEDQKRLLDIKVRLEDGGYGHVFSVRKTEHSFRWQCHLCDIIIVGLCHVDSHIQSKKHQVKMAVPSHRRQLFTRIEGEKESDVPVLAPGEPIPPGFEDEMDVTSEVAQIQPTLDRQKMPLVGLEYIVELNPNERGNEPQYVCVLCDKRGDPRVAMAHLTSFNHCSKYLGIHFPKASRAIAVSMPRTREGRKGSAEIVSKICSKVEEKYGRFKPLVLNLKDFESKKDSYREQIEKSQHFRETEEEDFVNVVETLTTTYSINIDEVPLPVAEPAKKEEVVRRKVGVDRSCLRPHAGRQHNKKVATDKDADPLGKKASNISDKGNKEKRSNSLSSISSVSSSSLSRSPSPSRSRSKSRTKSKSPSPLARRQSWRGERFSNRHRRRRSRSRGRTSPFHRRNRSRSRSDSKSRFRNPYKKNPRVQLKEIASERNEKKKWENFREALDKEESQLTKTLKFHEKNPEKHPMYPEEWKKFWNKRYKELQAEGKDPGSHDYKPEWIEFWNKRMREMHQEDLLLKKEELRLQLDLPKDEPTKNRYRPPKRSYPMETDDDIIIISPPPNKEAKRKFWKGKDERARNRSPSPWDDEEVHRMSVSRQWHHHKTAYPEREHERDKGRVHGRGGYRPPPAKPHYQEDDPVGDSKEPVKVVTVLRLLTAMESQLGSVGPTINNLLASALAMEKSRPGSSEALLGNSDNLVVFETVKEKLKGQLFAGIVEQGLMLATRSCIQNLAEILYRASKMAKESLLPVAPTAPALVVATPPAVVPVAAVTVPGVGAVDKAAIAQQIAAALVAQGKTDVTHEELEQLINAVVGMAHASASMDEPITTAAFASMQKKPIVVEKPPVVAPPPPTAPPAVVPKMSPPVIVQKPPVEEPSPLERLLSVVHSKTTPVERPKVSIPLFPCVQIEVPQAPSAPTISSSPVKKREPSPDPKKITLSTMEELNESDLKELLQNFKDLSTEEQHCLIAYLKKLEARDPDRVEKLRKFVNLGPPPAVQVVKQPKVAPAEEHKPQESKEDSKVFWKSGRLSPFSMRLEGGGANPLGGANPSGDGPFNFRNESGDDSNNIKLDDSDDDYSYEDIYAAASKKVSEKEKAKEAEEAAKKLAAAKLKEEKKISAAPVNRDDASNILRETKLMIANLMGQLPIKFNQKKVSPMGLNISPATPNPTITTPTKPVITTPPARLELPVRTNIGLNIDISNTLTDAESNSAPPAATKQTSGINVVGAHRQTLTSIPTTTDPCASPGPPTPGSNSHNSSYSAHNSNYSEQYSQHSFPDLQQPAVPGFQPVESYRQEPQPTYQDGYHNQAYPQAYPSEYGGNYNGYYPGNPQPQQQNPQYCQPAPMGYAQQAGYPQQHRPPQAPPYREPGPPQRFPNQYGGRGYAQYPNNQQGYY